MVLVVCIGARRWDGFYLIGADAVVLAAVCRILGRVLSLSLSLPQGSLAIVLGDRRPREEGEPVRRGQKAVQKGVCARVEEFGSLSPSPARLQEVTNWEGRRGGVHSIRRRRSVG